MMDRWKVIISDRRADVLAFDLLSLISYPEPIERSVRLKGLRYSPNDVVAAFLADDGAEGDLEACLVAASLIDEETYRDIIVKAADSIILRIKRGY